MLSGIISPIMNPLLSLKPLTIITIVAFVVTLIITLAYKWLTDQKLMKRLKSEMEEHQKQLKEHRNDPQKLMDIQKRSLEANMQYMKQSFKPTLYTMLPVLIIFAWLNAYVAYDPIMPGQTFTVTAELVPGSSGSATLEVIPEGVSVLGSNEAEIVNNKAEWQLAAEEVGDYSLIVKYKGSEAEKELLVSNLHEYKAPNKNYKNNNIKTIKIGNSPTRPLGNFSLFGWKPGWLATYITLSVIFSMALRKILKLH